MKKICFYTLTLLLLLLCLTFASCENDDIDTPEGEEPLSKDTVTLYVYNWGEYISDGSEGSLDTNKKFEEYCKKVLKKNVKVNYSTYSSNEDMYAKITGGQASYDIIIPSDYMIARLIAEDQLLPIYPAQSISNYQYIDPDFKGMYYDPTEAYSVPYTFGTFGIIYNTSMVPETEPNLGSWALMWDEKYKGDILQFRNPRDAFATAQFYLGKDINTTDLADWNAALEKLIEQKRATNTAYVMDEIFSKMQSGSAAIAPYYAGDFFTMYAENEDLAFFYPEEGVNIYVDAMCVPKSSKNPDLAKEYINFMLTEEIAVANAEYICYASPNLLVQQNEDYQTYMTEEIHPDALSVLYDFDRETTEYFHNLPTETLSYMNELWEELMIAGNPGTGIYILCAICATVMTASLITYVVIKKKRESYY